MSVNKNPTNNINKRVKSIVLILGTLLSLCIVGIISLILLVNYSVIGHIPSVKDIENINNPVSSNIYASNQEDIIGKFFIENRGNLNTSDLNEYYKNALVATEDVRYYQHNGIDIRSMGRVLFKSLLLRDIQAGGGSTLPQQVAKNIFPRQNFMMMGLVINKIREMIIARRLSKAYSKDDLLLLYSNTVSFGERAFGLHTAAHRFFNKEPKDLELEEAATLVGILKAPTYYSPSRHPQRAKKRRNVVLAQMLKAEFISPEEFEESAHKNLNLSYQSLNKSIGTARYFQQQVRKVVEEWAENNPKDDGSRYDIYRDGLNIYTTLDFELQWVAEERMRQHMKNLQRIFNDSWANGNKYGPNDKYLKTALKNSSSYQEMKKAGYSDSDIKKNLTEKHQVKVWYWDGSTSKELSTKDSIAHYLGLLHQGILAMNPKNGHVKVWVGGNDYGRFQWDNITSPRHVGSTFKPIVYYTALKKGAHPCDYYPNELRTYADYKNWTPRNADGKYGGYMSATEALTHSVNTVSVQMLFRSGIQNVIQQAEDMGITAELPEVPSIVLGTADISLLDMVKTYSYLANGGHLISPTLVTKITDRNGNTLFEMEPTQEFQDVDSTVYDLNAMMARVTKDGTGRRLYASYNIPFEVMGKTGTTQNQSDGWYISYTSDMVIGAWVGAQNKNIHFRNLGTGSGGRTALPLVGALWDYKAGSGYMPSADITSELMMCPDSISAQEYSFLKRNNDPDRFEKIIKRRNAKNRNPLEDIANIFRRELKRESSTSRQKVKRKRRKTTASRSNRQRKGKRRNNDFLRFRKNLRNFLKDL